MLWEKNNEGRTPKGPSMSPGEELTGEGSALPLMLRSVTAADFKKTHPKTRLYATFTHGILIVSKFTSFQITYTINVHFYKMVSHQIK